MRKKFIDIKDIIVVGKINILVAGKKRLLMLEFSGGEVN
jgi:hypothetical protein